PRLQFQARGQHRTGDRWPPHRHVGVRAGLNFFLPSPQGERGERATTPDSGIMTMTSDEILFDAEERMDKAVEHFRDELRGLRTGRATPALVDSIRVECYGSQSPLKQLAQISTPDPQQ